MKTPIILLYFMVMATFANSQDNAIIKISGIVRDAANKSPLIAQISIIHRDNSLKLSNKNTETQADGKFELSALPKEATLKIKAKGYISSTISVDFSKLALPEIICDIPLVKEAQQQIDQLYLQSTTQSGYTIDNKQASTNEKSTHVFQAIDGINGKNITARFRLISTQNGQEIKQETSIEKPSFTIDFTKKDIIAVEVTKDGYQKYLGNLIIESLDKKTHQNNAMLIKSLSFLNLIVENSSASTTIQVNEIGSTDGSNITLSQNGKIASALLNLHQKYRISISDSSKTPLIKEFEANEGINQILTAIEVKRNFVEEKQTLYFEQSSVTLKTDSKQNLDEILHKLKLYQDLKIEITGHTDNIGNYQQNQYLSEFRAKYIANFLYNNGIKDNRISIKADGSSKPIAENINEENRSQNRRVEIRLY